MHVDFSQKDTTIQPWGKEDVEWNWKQHVRGRNAGGMKTVETSPIMHNGAKVGEYKQTETLTYNNYVPEPFVDKKTEIVIGDKTKVIENREVAEGMYGLGQRYDKITITKETPEFKLTRRIIDNNSALKFYKDLRTGFGVNCGDFEKQYELLADVALGEKVSLPGLSKGKAKQILTRLFQKYLREVKP